MSVLNAVGRRWPINGKEIGTFNVVGLLKVKIISDINPNRHAGNVSITNTLRLARCQRELYWTVYQVKKHVYPKECVLLQIIVC